MVPPGALGLLRREPILICALCCRRRCFEWLIYLGAESGCEGSGVTTVYLYNLAVWNAVLVLKLNYPAHDKLHV